MFLAIVWSALHFHLDIWSIVPVNFLNTQSAMVLFPWWMQKRVAFNAVVVARILHLVGQLIHGRIFGPSISHSFFCTALVRDAKRNVVMQAGHVLLVVTLQHDLMKLITWLAPIIFWVIVHRARVSMSQRIKIALLLSQEEILLSLT